MFRVSAFDYYSPHVGDIKNANAIPHRQMFGYYALIPYGHFKASKNRQFRDLLMYSIKLDSASFFCQNFFAPAPTSYFVGFTSTLMGMSASFLPHFGHFPLCSCKISSGGLSSAPSYKTWPHC
jgi:hypothetical protein